MAAVLFQVALDRAQQRDVDDGGDQQAHGRDGKDDDGEEHRRQRCHFEDRAGKVGREVGGPVLARACGKVQISGDELVGQECSLNAPNEYSVMALMTWRGASASSKRFQPEEGSPESVSAEKLFACRSPGRPGLNRSKREASPRLTDL